MDSTDFWDKVWDLKRLLENDSSNGDEKDRTIDLINEYLRRNETKKFQENTLGIYKAAFGISNDIQNLFVLMQSARPGFSPKGFSIIDIPYSPCQDLEVKDASYQELIDYLFIQRRWQQPLRPEEESLRGDIYYGPEFLWSILGKWHPYAPPPHSQDQEIRNRFGCLYCSHGEISFFLYAWRYLIRVAQRGGIRKVSGPLELKAVQSGEFRGGGRIWYPPNWTAHPDLPERGWLDALEALKKEPEVQEIAFAVSRQWEIWSDALDENPVDPCTKEPINSYLADWINIGLLPFEKQDRILSEPIKVTATLKATIRYVYHLCSSISKIKSLEMYFYQLLCRLQDADPLYMTFQEIKGLDERFQIVVAWMVGEMGRVDTKLSILHSRARFPIIPYFYWTSADRLPKSHLAFPVWESHQFPVRIKVPKQIDPTDNQLSIQKQYDKNEPLSVDIETPIAGVCLMGIRPIEGLDWTLASCENEANTITYNGLTRLSWITTYYEQLATPVMDQGLYGNIIKAQLEERGGQQEWKRIIYSIGHAFKDPFTTLKQLVGDGMKVLEEGNKTSEVKNILDKLFYTLDISSGIAMMPGWLAQSQKKDNRPYKHFWVTEEEQELSNKDTNNFFLSKEFLSDRLLDAINYAQESLRPPGVEQGCIKLKDQIKKQSPIFWPSDVGRAYLARRISGAPEKIKRTDLTAAAVWSIVSEMLINSIRYNNPQDPSIRIVVNFNKKQFTFLVANRCDPIDRRQFQTFAHITSDMGQREYAGLNLTYLCLKALRWEEIAFSGPEEFSSASGPEEFSSAQEDRLRMLVKAEFDVNSPYQVFGFSSKFEAS